MGEPSMILCAECTCIIRKCSISKATHRAHPRHTLILDAEVGAIILSGRIGMKAPLNVGDAYEAILLDTTKSISNG